MIVYLRRGVGWNNKCSRAPATAIEVATREGGFSFWFRGRQGWSIDCLTCRRGTFEGATMNNADAVFVTRNTEYHVRGEICVAVRDRERGQYLPTHHAVGGKLSGSVRLGEAPAPIARRTPQVGDGLLVDGGPHGDGGTLVTSRILEIRSKSRCAA